MWCFSFSAHAWVFRPAVEAKNVPRVSANKIRFFSFHNNVLYVAQNDLRRSFCIPETCNALEQVSSMRQTVEIWSVNKYIRIRLEIRLGMSVTACHK